jgi:hypothetical protein
MRAPTFGQSNETGGPHAIAASTAGDRLSNLIVFAACFALLAGAVILNPPDPVTHYVTLGNQHLPSVCTFKNLTGLPCPGCGLVRSVTAMAHGNIAGSISYHRLGWLVFIYIFAQMMYRFVLIAIPACNIKRYGWVLQYGLLVVAILLILNWMHTLLT